MIRWQDAYTVTAPLGDVIARLGKDCICTTYGNIVHKCSKFIIIETHNTGGSAKGNDYFVIPRAVVLNKIRRVR